MEKRNQNLTEFIYFIRGNKVILDFHLASMYEVETRVLKQQVRRNKNRFPNDFMFQLTTTEWKELITNCDNLGSRKFSPSTPFAFTEQGIAMLSSVLRSEKAAEVNIAIMRTFVHTRTLLSENKELQSKISALEQKYDEQFETVFVAIRELIRKESEPRVMIGFKPQKPDDEAAQP